MSERFSFALAVSDDRTKGGNYEYHLLMDMNGEMAFVFDVSGAEKSEMNDFEKLHLYFMDGIIRTN